ncbi:DUF4123 domain-containing protein [Glaciimonas sp. GG7]
MYYGVDPHHPDLLKQTQTTLADYASRHDNLFTYLLVDGTFDDDLAADLWKYSQDPATDIVSLYDRTALAELEECAPFLLPISATWCDLLLQRSEGVPMLSFLQSPLTLQSLQRHFAAFLQVRTPSDGMRCWLRFADTVCSQNILRILDDAQRSAFCSGFTAWHIINREGTLNSIDGSCMDAATYIPSIVFAENAIDITDEQFGLLIESGEADYLLCNLGEKAPAIIADRKASALYAMIAELLAEMDKRAIKKEVDRAHLIFDALQMPNKYAAFALLDAAQEHGVASALQHRAQSV